MDGSSSRHSVTRRSFPGSISASVPVSRTTPIRTDPPNGTFTRIPGRSRDGSGSPAGGRYSNQRRSGFGTATRTTRATSRQKSRWVVPVARSPSGDEARRPVPDAPLAAMLESWVARNVSNSASGSEASASRPVSGLIRTLTSPSGGGGIRSGTPSSAVRMNLIHMGSAARPPTSLRPRVSWSSNPTQATATRPGTNPQNHASCWLLVVPVFPARSPRPSARALLPGAVADHVAQDRLQDPGVARRHHPGADGRGAVLAPCGSFGAFPADPGRRRRR